MYNENADGAPKLFVPMRGSPAATVAPEVPPAPNRPGPRPVMPRAMPGQIAAGRGVPTTAPQMPAQSSGAMAYAMDKFKEAGNPWTAAAQGMIHAQEYREGQDLEKAKREEAAKLLGGHPDLAQAVSSGILELPDAAAMAAKRDELQKTNDRKAQIVKYLVDAGDADLAEQFTNGVLDEDGVQKAVAERDKPETLTEDQKMLKQINAERVAAGKPELSTEDYMTQKKAGNLGIEGVLADDTLPLVMLNEKGIPDPEAQQVFIDGLDPQTASIVKGIANYELDINKVTSLKGAERQRVAALVKQYDPTFDMTQYPARAAMKKSITSGTYSQSLNSANLVIQHLDELSKAGEELHNQSGIMTPWNKIASPLKNAFGQPEVTRFEEAKNAVASELGKVFKGAGVATGEEIEAWKATFDNAASPEQMKQAITTGINLLKSRIDTIHTQYNAAMGKPSDFTFLTPHTRQVLEDLGYDPSYLDSAAPPGEEEKAWPANPLDAADGAEPAAPEGEYPEGTVIQNDAGETLTMTNGEWV